jgi:hypothetical protein
MKPMSIALDSTVSRDPVRTNPRCQGEPGQLPPPGDGNREEPVACPALRPGVDSLERWLDLNA